jgi:hypothetical protein
MVAKVTYSVARVTPEDVRGEVTRLWKANLISSGDVERKFERIYRECPEPAPTVFMLAADGEGERRWVGTAGVAIRHVRVGGRDLRAGLLADLAVDRDHRSLLPALSLVRAVKEWVLSEMDLAYGFPNNHAEGVFKRVGYRPLGMVGRWVRVLRHAGYASRVKEAELPRVPRPVKRVVDRAADVGAIAAVAGGAVDLVQLARIAPSAVQAARKIKLAWSDVPDGRMDRVWEAARDEYEVAGVRSSQFLAWRFPPQQERAIAIASSRSDGAPLAYAVIDHLDRVAYVQDLFGTREAVVWLLDLLVPALYPRGATAASMRYLGAPWLVEALEARGWVSRQNFQRQVFVGAAASVDAEARALLGASEHWYLTDADEDA